MTQEYRIVIWLSLFAVLWAVYGERLLGGM
jgi:hypothetical protein